MNSERSLADIAQDILASLRTILRAEILLAKSEMRADARAAISAGKGMAVGGALLIFGALFTLIAITAALALVIPLWGASLVVGGALILVGGILVTASRKRLASVSLTPDRALENIKETLKWTTQQTR